MAIDRDVHTCFQPWNKESNGLNAEFKLSSDCASTNNTGLFIFQILFNHTMDCGKLQNSLLVSNKSRQEMIANGCKLYKQCKPIRFDKNTLCEFKCETFLPNSIDVFVSLLVRAEVVTLFEESEICEMNIKL